MIKLTAQQTAEFLRRSYTAVDGLWFMKVEEKYGFEAALEIDRAVWMIFPKIQARLLKSAGNLDKGIDALAECYSTRLALENFTFQAEKSTDGVRFTIENCPWHNVMVKSGREKLSGRIGEIICLTECEVWAKEFGEGIRFEPESRICKGATKCMLRFGI